MSTSFPTAPTFATTHIQPPPALLPEQDVEAQIKTLHNYLNSQYVSLNDMQTSIESGWLIETVRILNLDASVITSDSIFTQDLYVGSDQKIQLLGSSNRIEVYDEQGTPELRTRIGDLGTGTTNWGQEWWDSSGNLIMSVGDSVFIDGAIILSATIGGGSFATGAIDSDDIASGAVDAVHIAGAIITGSMMVGGTITNVQIANSTITNSEINDVNGSKLATGSVANAKLGSISADKITLSGTLTCTGSQTVINVTSSGAVTFSSGGDIIMKASASGDTNYLQFQTSGGSVRGYVTYSVGNNRMQISSQGSVPLFLSGTPVQTSSNFEPVGTANIGTASNGWSTVYTGTVSSDSGVLILDTDDNSDIMARQHFRPNQDSTLDCGTNTYQWRTVYRDAEGDIPMRNALVITEADMVYKDMHRDDGVFVMVRTKHIRDKDFEWYPVMFVDRHGNVHCKKVIEDSVWPTPDYHFKGNGKVIHEETFYGTEVPGYMDDKSSLAAKEQQRIEKERQKLREAKQTMH